MGPASDADPSRPRDRHREVTGALTRQATLVRRCRDFYARRLRQSELLRRKWHEGSGSDGDCSSTTSTLSSASSSSASSSSASAAEKDNTSSPECRLAGGSDEQAGWRKSSLDLAMDSLRREISCLMERDNALFGQLLGLHQSIAELRAQRQQHWLHHRPPTLVDDSDEDVDDEDDDDDDVSSTGPAPSPHTPGSLESLSAYEEDRLTLSSSASSSDSRDQKKSARRSTGGPTSRCASSGCWRCVRGARATALPPGFRNRRALSQASLVLRHEHADSYDSGIQLQGSHSESDHEVFV